MPIRTAKRVKLPAPQASNAKALSQLNVPMIRQEQTNWCWAACAQMSARYYGNATIGQCDLANYLFNQTACCAIPGSSICNDTCSASDVISVYNFLSLDCKGTPSSVPFQDLQNEVSLGKRPVEVGLYWNNSAVGHVALVVDADVINGEPVLRVNDPELGSGGVTYQDLLTAYSQGKWSWTFTNIQPKSVWQKAQR